MAWCIIVNPRSKTVIQPCLNFPINSSRKDKLQNIIISISIMIQVQFTLHISCKPLWLPEWIPYSGGKRNKLELHGPQMYTAYALLSHPKPTIKSCIAGRIQYTILTLFKRSKPLKTQWSSTRNLDHKIYHIQWIIAIHHLLITHKSRATI